MKCARCGGSGEELDQQAVSAELVKARTDAGISQARMARYLGTTSSYLCCLEKGGDGKRWTRQMIENYRAGIQALRGGKEVVSEWA